MRARRRRHAFRFPQRDHFPLVSFVGSILCNSHVALLLYFACLSLGTFPRTVWIFFPFGLIHLVPLLPANAVFIQPTMLVCRSWVGRYLLTANVALDLPSFGPLAFLSRFSFPFVCGSTSRSCRAVVDMSGLISCGEGTFTYT